MGRPSSESEREPAARPEPAIPIVLPDCPMCGKQVRELASALTHRVSRQPAHFDCVVRELRESNAVAPQEKICYLGGGSFGILEFSAAAGSPRFVIKKRIQYRRKRNTPGLEETPAGSLLRGPLDSPRRGHHVVAALAVPVRLNSRLAILRLHGSMTQSLQTGAPGVAPHGRSKPMSLKYALLGLLSESPKYGYEIKRQFEGALGNVWSVSYGQLYPTLRRLSEQGWVTKRTEPGKKAAEKNIYSITDKGRRKLDEWLLNPVRSSYRVKDEFTLRFLFFRKIAPGQVLDYLRGYQKKTREQRESFRSTLQTLNPGMDFYLQGIIRKGIVHLEAEDRWLEEVMEAIAADGKSLTQAAGKGPSGASR